MIKDITFILVRTLDTDKATAMLSPDKSSFLKYEFREKYIFLNLGLIHDLPLRPLPLVCSSAMHIFISLFLFFLSLEGSHS